MRAPGLQEPARTALATLDREWDGLIAHRDYPMVSLGNNLAERTIRGPVVTRKNVGGSHNRDTTQQVCCSWRDMGDRLSAGRAAVSYAGH